MRKGNTRGNANEQTVVNSNKLAVHVCWEQRPSAVGGHPRQFLSTKVLMNIHAQLAPECDQLPTPRRTTRPNSPNSPPMSASAFDGRLPSVLLLRLPLLAHVHGRRQPALADLQYGDQPTPRFRCVGGGGGGRGGAGREGGEGVASYLFVCFCLFVWLVACLAGHSATWSIDCLVDSLVSLFGWLLWLLLCLFACLLACLSAWCLFACLLARFWFVFFSLRDCLFD